jgi:hypothetical protein
VKAKSAASVALSDDERCQPDFTTCPPAAQHSLAHMCEYSLKLEHLRARAVTHGSRKHRVETQLALPRSSFFSPKAQRLYRYVLCLASLQKLTRRTATAKIRRLRRSSRLEDLDLRSPSTGMRRFRIRIPVANGAKQRGPSACSGKDRRRASVCTAAPAIEHATSVYLQLCPHSSLR